MALVANGWQLTITFRDTAADEVTRTIALNAADAAAASTAAAAVMAAYAAVSNALIVRYIVGEIFDETTAVLPVVDCEVENQALLSFNLTGKPTANATHKIPAAKIEIFRAATGRAKNEVDLADPAVIAFQNLFVPPSNVATISDGDTVASIDRGRRVHKGTRIG